MTEWKEYKFSDFVEINPSVMIPKGIPVSFVEMKDLDCSVRYCESSQLKELTGGSRFMNGDTLFARITPCLENGKICQVRNLKNGYGFGSTEFHVFRGKEGVSDNDFVYYLSRWDEVRDFAEHNLEGSSGRQRVSKEAFDNLFLILPPLPTQRRIAAILSSLDDKIDLLHRENATLEQMAETLFRQWFVVEAKEDWEEKELREIVDISIGRTPPRKETKWFSTNPSDVKWLSIKDMGAGDVFLFNTSEYLTKEAVETFSIPIIPKNTVVLSFKMTVGRVGITTEDMLSNEAIAHFKFTNKTPITKEYLYLFLKSFKYDSLGSTSSIVTAINSAMIKQMQIIIPDEVIMKKFEEQTQYIFDKIYSNQKQIQTLIQTRDELLPRLMGGEIKITEI